jgi:hypothetical protein
MSECSTFIFCLIFGTSIIIGIPVLITGCDTTSTYICPLYNQRYGNLTAVTSTACNCNSYGCSQCQAFTFVYPNGVCVATVTDIQSFFAGGSYSLGSTLEIWVNTFTGVCIFNNPTIMKARVYIGLTFLSIAGFVLLCFLLSKLVIFIVGRCDRRNNDNGHYP